MGTHRGLLGAEPGGGRRPRVDGYVLGDAYQAFSAEARKSRALCQTPPWIAELLLELALSPGSRKPAPTTYG